jgi:hypothetical protein
MELPPPAGAGNRPIPPAGGNRRWIPAAIIAAGIVIAGALIGGAVIASNRASTDTPADAAAAEASSTCQAWKTTRAALGAIPLLPVGWNWDTPNIDVFINNQANAAEKALTVFESQIAAEPANVAAAAREYIEVRRNEYTAMRNRTYSATEAAPVPIALGTLNELCGITP